MLWPLNPDGSSSGGVIAGEGELALFSGTGGGGKSAILLEAMVFGAAARRLDADMLPTPCNLGIAPVTALYAGYEDSLARVNERIGVMRESWEHPHRVTIDAEEGGVAQIKRPPLAPDISDALVASFEDVHLAACSEPLFAPPEGAYGSVPIRTSAFDALWLRAERVKANLVVIDPATAAFVGNANESGHVRAFMTALSVKAAETGIAVVVVSHDTKAARSETARSGAAAGAAAVSGSSQWHDTARALLWLTFVPPVKGPASTASEEKKREYRANERDRARALRVLRVEKANYGSTGFQIGIGTRRLEDNRWAGWSATDDIR